MDFRLLPVASLVLSAHGAEKVKNVGYIMQGYNVFHGNPSSTGVGVDPGFNTFAGEKVFEETYADKRLTADGRYMVPDGFDLIPNVGCTISFDATSEYKTSDYRKSLERKASFSLGVPDASFTASRDYKNFHEQTYKKNRRVITSTAECVKFSVMRREYTQPNFTSNWFNGINNLPKSTYDNYTSRAYFDFLDAFGTHIMTEVQLGSRFGFTAYFTQQAWTNVAQSGVSLKVAAKLEGNKTAGGSLETDKERAAQKAFETNATSLQMITLGKRPVRGDPVQWASDVDDEPMPISYIFKPICELMDHDHEARTSCYRALLDPNEYCTKRLKHRGDVDSCHHQKVEPDCQWNMHCPGTDACVNGACYKTQAVHKYKQWWFKAWRFHFPPTPKFQFDYTGEDNEPFYAFTDPIKDKDGVLWSSEVSEFEYSGNILAPRKYTDWSVHFPPAWSNEHQLGVPFHAFNSSIAGARPVHQYWDTHMNSWNFHFPPALDNEEDRTGFNGPPFFAYKLSDLGAWDDEGDEPALVPTQALMV